MSDKVISRDWQEQLKDLENESILCILKIISLSSYTVKIGLLGGGNLMSVGGWGRDWIIV
ncbi:hypothetical protein [Bartonella sp. MU70NMGDW]|uniref:hypothetical protein n=1 Tax=Bartonella sp. MU70NMGDW TaxID=3243561 RepID=UPI0035D08B12